MRIPCPICGERDRREFYYMGDAVALDRPGPGAADAAWDDYLHNRDNPAGVTRDLWYHGSGCAAWVVVTRDTVTHEMLDAALAVGADVILADEDTRPGGRLNGESAEVGGLPGHVWAAAVTEELGAMDNERVMTRTTVTRGGPAFSTSLQPC